MGFPGKVNFPICPIILPCVATRVSFQQCLVLSTRDGPIPHFCRYADMPILALPICRYCRYCRSWLPIPILPILKNVPICRYFRYRYQYRPIPTIYYLKTWLFEAVFNRLVCYMVGPNTDAISLFITILTGLSCTLPKKMLYWCIYIFYTLSHFCLKDKAN